MPLWRKFRQTSRDSFELESDSNESRDVRLKSFKSGTACDQKKWEKRFREFRFFSQTSNGCLPFKLCSVWRETLRKRVSDNSLHVIVRRRSEKKIDILVGLKHLFFLHFCDVFEAVGKNQPRHAPHRSNQKKQKKPKYV